MKRYCVAGNGGRNKAFFNDKIRVTEKAAGERREEGYRMPYSCTFSEPGLWIEGGEGNLRGKAGNRHDFFAPVEIRKGRAPSPVLRLFSTLFLSLSLYFFVQGYVYIYTSFES